MNSLHVYSISAARRLASVRLISVVALQSALLSLCAHGASPVIYSFAGSTGDGANPHRAVVINASGTLYGTTVYGGSSTNCTGGCGTVYKLVPGTGGTWTESVLHNFAGTTTDGAQPDGDLILSGTSLYGTTSIGGVSTNDGTVFQEKNSSGTWTESVLYSFAGGTGDGNGPFAGVILNSSVLYGTTFYGGSSSNGTVYSLTPGTPWTESVLYSFGSSPDGANPHAALVFAGSGVYYGTTYNGGSSTNCTGGCGTVYKLVLSGSTWTETVLYNFTGGTDGANPHSPLIIDSNGALYGTTVLGGAYSKGTVYKLTQGMGGTWTESILYSFSGGSDGAIPRAGVVFGSSQTTLYGATTIGGGSGACTNDCGTVYKLVLSSGTWTETILHSFTGTSGDGADPYSDVIYSGGWIYGTTFNGGTSTNCTGGCVTVYALQP